MAGVALGDMDLHFAWQAWHLWHGAGSGGALGSRLAPWTPPLFAWHAWHLATSSVTLRGRRGIWRHRASLCVAGVALMTLGWLWWHAWFPVGAVDAAAVCVEGVALGDIERHFAWQVWHLATSSVHFAWQAWHLATSSVTLRGRRGQAWHLWHWAGSGGVLGSQLTPWTPPLFAALGDIERHFAWQAWHLATWTSTLRGRRGTYGTLRGRRGTWRHGPPLYGLLPLVHTTCPHTTCPHTTCPHTYLSTHILAHTHLATGSHTNLSSHNLLTHGLVHTQLSHTQLDNLLTQLAGVAASSLLSTHNLSSHNLFTYNWPTSKLAHTHLCNFLTTCPHTTCSHTTYSHTTCSPHNFLTLNLFTHDLLTHGFLVAHANPSPSLFSFLLNFPCHLYLSFAACWKKLTCGAIRSFNLFFHILGTIIPAD